MADNSSGRRFVPVSGVWCVSANNGRLETRRRGNLQVFKGNNGERRITFNFFNSNDCVSMLQRKDRTRGAEDNTLFELKMESNAPYQPLSFCPEWAWSHTTTFLIQVPLRLAHFLYI